MQGAQAVGVANRAPERLGGFGAGLTRDFAGGKRGLGLRAWGLCKGLGFRGFDFCLMGFKGLRV